LSQWVNVGILKRVGRNIKWGRTERDSTQQALAERVGTSRF